MSDELPSRLTDKNLGLMRRLAAHRRENRMEFWKPYPKQLEFLNMGAFKTERCFFAGNQLGKTETGAFEMSCHLTGLYPEWWNGYRFKKPGIKAWALGVSTTTVRDVMQTKLCGPPAIKAEHGTGYIPRAHLLGHTLARGAVADAWDSVTVQHHDANGVPDGISTLWFKSYEQGREKLQGATLDLEWWDEEPTGTEATGMYTEGLARLTATRGISYMTFTPEKGRTEIVDRYMGENGEDSGRGYVRMGFRDAGHLTEEDLARKKSEYPKHEWEARLEGIPMLGSGKIFPYDPKALMVPPFGGNSRYTPTVQEELASLIRYGKANPGQSPIASGQLIVPEWWVKIWGIDFGIAHPFAAVLIAYDREADTVYVLKCYRVSGGIPSVHAHHINLIASDVPIAWPHDGTAREKGSGDALATIYKRSGLKMLPEHSTMPGGGYSTEAAVTDMQKRMEEGRFKVCEDLVEWWEEFAMYHRDHKPPYGIVKVRDDLMSATQKAIMMLRSAKPGPIGYVHRQQQRTQTVARDMDAWMEDL
jgi:phage terminase large subunit-like protein